MNKKAFTLIELLAVIIVLGVLATLIAPKVVNMINEAGKNTYMTSAEGLVKAASYKYSNNDIVGTINENIIIDYGTETNIDYLDYSGDKPESGQVRITTNGKIALAVKFGDYCYSKSYNSSEITVTEYNINVCGSKSNAFINYELPSTVTSGDGLYVSSLDEGRYIYRGTNPNNYIWIDENGDNNKTEEEMYRIISYEADGTIKVIRNNSIGNMSWDTRTSETEGPRFNTSNTYCQTTSTYYGCNAWGNQSNTYLNNVLLNNQFYYQYYLSNSSTNFSQGESGTVTVDSSLNTYLNNTWINSIPTISNYIETHQFGVGGIFYIIEYNGEDKGIEMEKEEIDASTWNGKIGLMYATDLVESSTNPECKSVYSNFYYNSNYYYDSNGDAKLEQNNTNWPCATNNWIFRNISEWTISPRPHSENIYNYGVWRLHSSGYLASYYAYGEFGVRPTFYLKSSTNLTGFGTEENPFIIFEG